SGQGGEELSDYMFQIPGDYVVEIIPLSGSPDPPSNSCGENVVPTLLFVSVQPYAFIIDTGTITYSHPVQAGKEMTGESLEVDVILESYQNQNRTFDWIIKASGVECTIAG